MSANECMYCMYVCMFVRMYVCLHTCSYVCMSVSKSVCLFVCMHVSTCMHRLSNVCKLCAFLSIRSFENAQHICARTHARTHAYIHTHTHTHTHTYTHSGIVIHWPPTHVMLSSCLALNPAVPRVPKLVGVTLLPSRGDANRQLTDQGLELLSCFVQLIAEESTCL